MYSILKIFVIIIWIHQRNHDEPNPNYAAEVGDEENALVQYDVYTPKTQDFVLKLPGISVKNYRYCHAVTLLQHRLPCMLPDITWNLDSDNYFIGLSWII